MKFSGPFTPPECRPRRSVRRVAGLATLALLLGGLGLAGLPGQAPAPARAEPPQGLLAFTSSHGMRILYQPSYELSFSRVSVYLDLPAELGPRSQSVARLLGRLYLDTAAEGEDTPRQALAAANASVSFFCDGSRLVFELLCVPETLSRALPAFLETLSGDRVREPFWSQACRLTEDQTRQALALGWDEIRPELEDRLLAGEPLTATPAPVGGDVPPQAWVAAAWPRMITPRTVHLVVTGRGDVAGLARAVFERTAGWKTPAGVAWPAAAPGRPEGVNFAEWNLPAQPPRIVVMFRGPGRESADLGSFLVGCSLLADGFTSLAGRLLRSGDDWCPALLQTRFALGRERSLYTVEILCPPDRFDEAERRFFTAAEMVSLGQWHEVDLIRARHQAFGHLAESLGSRGVFHEMVLEKGQPVRPEVFHSWRQRLAAPTAKAVSATAGNRLRLSQALVLELPGWGHRRGFTPAAFRETLGGLLPISLRETLARFKEEPDIPLLVPAEDPDPELAPEKVEKTVPSGILRGPTVLLREAHRWPLVWLRAAWPGGNYLLPAGKRGLNGLALLARLLSTRDPQNRLWLERLEMLGGRVQVIDEIEWSGLAMTCPAYFRQPVTGLLFQILHRGGPTAEDLDRSTQLLPLFGQNDWEDPATLSLAAALRSFYGPDHPAARLRGELTSVDRQALTDHYDQAFFRALPALALVGHFDGTELLPAIGESLSGSEFTAAKVSPPAAVFREGKLPEAELGAAGPALISLVLPGPYSGERELPRLEVLRRLYLTPDAAVPPVPFRLEIQPLKARGYLNLQFIAADPQAWPQAARSLLDWLQSLPDTPVNLWRLATAARLAELDENARLAEPALMADWLVQLALWDSKLYEDEDRAALYRKIRREMITEMLGRFLEGTRFAAGAAPLSAPAAEPAPKEP